MFDLLIIESKRQWLLFKRYPVESFAGVVVFTIIFFGLFTGARYLAGPGAAFGNRLNVIVAGYILWLVTTGLYGGPGAQLLEDMRSGILEQLFLIPSRFSAFAALRVLAGLLQHLLLIAILVVIVSLVTRSHLHYNIAEAVPFIAVILGASGLGLAVAAYVLVIKQSGVILTIGQFLLLGFVVTPVASFGKWGPWLSAVIPINPASQILQNELASRPALGAPVEAIAIANGVCYCVIGLAVLEIACRHVRRAATVGHF